MSTSIIIMGDSTLQFNDFRKYPQTGWPQALPRFLKEDVKIKNFAKNGRSTKSFIDQGLFDKALSIISSGDLVLIEFGHNDLKDDPLRHTDPYTTYKDNLKRMALSAKEKGADVVLLTSIAERVYVNGKPINTHKEYPKAMKELALELDIPCIDLNKETLNVLELVGETKSKAFYMNFSDGDYLGIPGKEDNTHLRYEGAMMIATIFHKEMQKLGLRRELFIDEV